MNENDLAYKVIGVALHVHSALGPGLLENIYKECLYYKLQKAGIKVEKEKSLPVVYEEIRLECGYRLDMVVENKLVLELKSVDSFSDVHLAQTLTYLKLGNYKLGLLINFNVLHLKSGIKRIANNL